MFIPPTPGSKLLKKLMDVEDIFKQNGRMEWGVKLVEKSGVSLINTLRTRYPIESGCPLGEEYIHTYIYSNQYKYCRTHTYIHALGPIIPYSSQQFGNPNP